MKPVLLHTKSLAVGYGGKPLLREIEISVRPGEIFALIGPNGAGKSTLLKTLARQLEPAGGTVFLGEQPMSALRENEIARSLSIVVTDRAEAELMTCEDVVRSGRYPYTGRLGILSEQDRAKAEEAMELVGVTDLRDREFRRISDGQRQRVMLARAICQEPEVLIMDEPTSFLDIRYQLELLDTLRSLADQKHIAVILSIHELHFARKIADTVLCIRAGAVDRIGPPEEVLTAAYIERLYDLPAGSWAEYHPEAGGGTRSVTGADRRGSGTGDRHGSDTPEQTGSTPEYPPERFVQNRACPSFPCHTGVEPERFNCLFCYCPLYPLGRNCGGNCTYTEKGVKSCLHCNFPHVPEHYGDITGRFPELAALAGQGDAHGL